MTLVNLRRKDDPIKRSVEKPVEDAGISPMSPPDAYRPPSQEEEVPYDDMHPVLQRLRDEHNAIGEKIDAFEKALLSIQENGIDRSVDGSLREFFRCLDEEVIPHSRREEKELFPLLSRRLLERGEHSKSGKESPTTPIDILEDDHLQIVQLSAIVLNLFALGGRLPDKDSMLLVFDTAMQQAKTLVELLRLHIFREDNVVFALAHKHIKPEEFDKVTLQ